MCLKKVDRHMPSVTSAETAAVLTIYVEVSCSLTNLNAAGIVAQKLRAFRAS